MKRTVREEWGSMDGKRQPLLTRCRSYAGYTLSMICTPVGYDEQTQELQNDYQSVGAQLVNNLANKLMLSLFAPSRPFFRLDVPQALMDKLAAMPDMDATKVQSLLSVSERNCIKTLDGLATRPKLYEATKHLIVTGNALMMLGRPMRVLGLSKYVTKRNQSGKMIKLIIREHILIDELEDDVQSYLKAQSAKYSMDYSVDGVPKVEHFIRIEWDGHRYNLTQHVDELDLPAQFSGSYTEDDLPYRALTWDLADENDYGTGLVEQCKGDFAAMSILSEAEVKAAVLASEFRWLVNPAGMTKPEDIEQSENGAALPGVESDITPLTTGTGAVVSQIDATNSKYITRLGRTFLLGASVIRDAERVTAEEVRLQATELETSLGGVYSRLAIDFQYPIAVWLVKENGVKLAGTSIKPMIITGLDALSRNGDLDLLKQCIQDAAGLTNLPPGAQAVLKMDAIMMAFFTGRGIDPSLYVKTPQEQAADQQQQQQQVLAEQAARPVAQAAVQQGQQGNQ